VHPDVFRQCSLYAALKNVTQTDHNTGHGKSMLSLIQAYANYNTYKCAIYEFLYYAEKWYNCAEWIKDRKCLHCKI